MIFLQSVLAHVLPKCGALPIRLLGRVWYPEGPTTLFDSRPWSDVSCGRLKTLLIQERHYVLIAESDWVCFDFAPAEWLSQIIKLMSIVWRNIHPCLAEFNPVVWRWFDCPHQLVLKFNTQREVLGRGTQVAVQSWRYKHLCELVYPLTTQWWRGSFITEADSLSCVLLHSPEALLKAFLSKKLLTGFRSLHFNVQPPEL